MRRLMMLGTGLALGVGALAGTAVGVSVQAASADSGNDGARSHSFHVHEKTAGNSFLDLGTAGPSFGDELAGANTLVGANGAAAGTDSFVCTSVSADGSALQCAVVYSLKGGRVTAQGFAKIVGSHPLFDENFAVTGGTKMYQKVRGQVRVLQSSQKDAELFFHLVP